MRALSAPFDAAAGRDRRVRDDLAQPGIASRRPAGRPSAGGSSRSRDQNVIAFWLGSPDATPSLKRARADPTPRRQQLLGPGGRDRGDGAGGADRGDELAACEAQLGHLQAEPEGRRHGGANRANSECVDLQAVAARASAAGFAAARLAACRARCRQPRARTCVPSGPVSVKLRAAQRPVAHAQAQHHRACLRPARLTAAGPTRPPPTDGRAMLGRHAPPSRRSPAIAWRKRSCATAPATGRSVPIRTHSSVRRVAGTGRTSGPGPWRSTQPSALSGVGCAPAKTESVAASPPSALNVQRPVLGGRTRRQTLAAAGQGATNGSSCVMVAPPSDDGRLAAARDRRRRAVRTVAVGLVTDRERGLRERELDALVVGGPDRAAAADLDQHVAKRAHAERHAGRAVPRAVAAAHAGARAHVRQLRDRLAGAGLDERGEIDDVERPAGRFDRQLAGRLRRGNPVPDGPQEGVRARGTARRRDRAWPRPARRPPGARWGCR